MAIISVKIVIFLIYIFATSFFYGQIIKKYLKNIDIIESIILGYVFDLGISEFILWPFVAFRLSMNIFLAIYIVKTLLFTGIGIYIYIKEKEKNNINIHNINLKDLLNYVILIILVIVEIVLTFIYYRSDADDSFYVSNSTLFSQSQNINEYDSSFGNADTGTVPMYDFQIWETVITVYSKIFFEESVIVAHVYIIPLMLILAVFASYSLGIALFKDKKKACIFSIMVILFNLFAGFSVYTQGSFLLSRVWQGKAVYLNIVLPIVISIILKNADNNNNKLYIYLAILTLAGFALNPTSLYVIGFQIVFMVIGTAIYKKNPKYLLHLILSLLIIAFFTVAIYLRTKNYDGQISAASNLSHAEVIAIIKRFFAGKSKIYLILFFISMLVIFRYGNSEQKIYLIVTPILLAIFIWNPISGKFVAENITKTSSFWRVYWLVPYIQAISVMMILIMDKINNKYLKMGFIVISILMIIYPGKWLISKNNGFIICNNIERLPDDTIYFGEIIEKYNSSNKVLLAKEGINTTMRQKYSDIELIYSRQQYILDLFVYRNKQTEADERCQLQTYIDGTNNGENTDLKTLLYKYDIGWVIINKNYNDSILKICENDYSLIESTDESYLLKRNDI